MAPRGNKRAATGAPAEEPGAKRASDFMSKQGVSKASYQPVLETLQHPLSGLSESDRRLVLAVLPWSLAVPADERHEAQEAVVLLVDAAVEHVRAELEKAASVESSKLDELHATRVEQESAVQRAEAAEAEAQKALEECSACLAEVDAAVPQKRAALQQTEIEHRRVKTEMEQTHERVTELEGMLSGSFATLQDVSYADGEAEGLVQAVLGVASKIGLDESVITTLPASLGKRERGSFDQAVICEAERALQGKLLTLRTAAEAAKAPFAEQAEHVRTAQSELDAELANQAKATDEFRHANERSAEASASVKAAKLELAGLGAKVAAATAAQSEKRSELEQFCAYNVCLYQVLRDRKSSPKQQSVEQVEDMSEPELAASEDPTGI